jgi:hypothetical protein
MVMCHVVVLKNKDLEINTTDMTVEAAEHRMIR